ITGKSSWTSLAPSLSKRSKVWSTTHPGRLPGRSILFTTTIAFSPWASALRVTKRVCGMGPSTASTSSSTPSTMDSTRSTSPPKSACPGVLDGAVLREDGDATLSLDVVGIHDALAEALVGGESTGLLQQAVDQGRLAVVDVRDDGDVADRAIHGGATTRGGANRYRYGRSLAGP